MKTELFLNYSLEELSELGLLNSNGIPALKNANIHCLNDILNFYKENESFNSLQACPAETIKHLDDFAYNFLHEQNHVYTANELFSDSFHKEQKFFVPVIIDWNNVSVRHKHFLDIWINYVINWYSKPEITPSGYSIVFESQLGWENAPEYLARKKQLTEFLSSTFGKEVTAETFYEKAIVHPQSHIEKFPLDHNISKCLFYLRCSFLKYYKATQVFTDTFDLLRFFARNEFYIKPDDEIYQEILDHQSMHKKFPFAKAVYSIVSKSSYFNRMRGFQDINMERFPAIFNKEPYTSGILKELFGMSLAAFNKLKSDSDFVAENGCRITIAVLKALGFKHYYPENPFTDNKKVNPRLVSNINYLEGLYLPEGFYGVMFGEISDGKLVLNQ